MTQTSLYISGEWKSGQGAEFHSIDPASSQTVWHGQSATREDVSEAFRAARKAFIPWALKSFDERRSVIEAYKAIVTEKKAEFAELISRETGKLLWDSTGEAGALAAKAEISIKSYEDRTGGFTNETDFGYAQLAHKPLGVLFALGPYNFPAHLPNGHIIPALLAGNTIVFKPSELTPAVGELMVRCWEEAGLPPGVLNLVQGARETGAAALDNPELDGVLFTGSWNTGSFIHKKFAGRTGIQLALEMGGNNPLVIWDSRDAEAAARIAIHSAFITTGQRCSCARRLILPEGRFGDDVLQSLVDLADQLKPAAWNDQTDAFMGPLVSEAAAHNTLKGQEDRLAKGATSLLTAQQTDRGQAFVTAGIVEASSVSLDDEEIFGPLLTVKRASSFEDALIEANNTAYGLAAGLVSENADLWKQFWAGSRAGIVNWNRPTPGAASNMPFGGPGQSGNLRPSAYYAADYCAYPVASQASESVEALSIKGIS